MLKSRRKHKKEAHPIAFSELVSYICETKIASEESKPPIFRLADLVHLYKERLERLGSEAIDVNSTRLKDQLISHIPHLEAHKQGRDILMAFKNDVGTILAETSKYNDAINLAKAASMLRREMLQHKSTFESFLEGDTDGAVPSLLLQFVSMIEHGSDIKSQLEHGASKSDIAIAQLLQYNCFDKYKEGAQTHRHSKDCETPFAVYMGLSVFGKTRKRHLIDMLDQNGLSIPYHRVLEISAQLGEAVVAKYVEDGVVCPPILKKGLFTTSAIDNIDHNPTATTSSTSFHGTSVSVFQHINTEGEERDPLKLTDGTKKVKRCS